MKSIQKKTIVEAICIIITASILGLGVNTFHPKGVQITSKRPPLEFATDSVFAYDLPNAEIKVNQINGAKKQEIIEVPVIVNTEQILQWIANDQALLLDARSEQKFQKEHIPKAQNLPFDYLSDYEQKAKSLPKDKWLICYCDGPPCELAESLAYELVNMGYKMVAIYYDGIKAWKQTGNVVQRKERPQDAK